MTLPDSTIAETDLVVLMPTYEDWPAVGQLLRQLDETLAGCGIDAAVLIVDDASRRPMPREIFQSYRALRRLIVLRLKANLGHQRAIATGMSYLHDHIACKRILVMDADGEDRAEDIPLLLNASKRNDGSLIFAERARRSEPLFFRAGYSCYRALFRILTGQRIRFGNFSVVPAELLAKLVWLGDLWNNYAAAAMKARLPIHTVACDRGCRLSGVSKMSLVRLILHGLSAISVYNEIFGARALIASVVVMAVALGLGATAVIIRFSTNLAVPGWATYAVGLSVLAILQAISLTVFFVFLILHSRNNNPFVPGRDYACYVAETTQHCGSGERTS